MRDRRALLVATVLGAALAGTQPAMAETRTAIFAGGCFWCVEADFDHVPGVVSTLSGYTGGVTENPTYRNHAAGGHRETVKIEYDSTQRSYEQLLDTFFRSVDPTDIGGQFCDRGQNYATAIYVLDEEQRRAAEAAKQRAEAELGQKVVTSIEPASTFWPAEDYHQNYYQSQELVLTRFGLVTKARAYKGYREGCGRDQRLRELWGESALQGIEK